MNRILVIQTAYIGDVVLMTGLLETLHAAHSEAKIDILVRANNSTIFTDHPFINKVILWDKETSKYKNLLKVTRLVGETNYDLIINLQRYASAGFVVFRAKAKTKIGFKGSFFSRFYDVAGDHIMNNGKHEVERNFELLNSLKGTNYVLKKPRLHISNVAFPANFILDEKYVVLAPSSVWETKKMPEEKWIALAKSLPTRNIYILGGPKDKIALAQLANRMGLLEDRVITKFSLLQSAKLMANATRNFVNDSGPLHLASATNAPVTAFFCSTVPGFGFGPLSDDSKVIEVDENLSCRPCGLHGHKSCPEGHFKCGKNIKLPIQWVQPVLQNN